MKKFFLIAFIALFSFSFVASAQDLSITISGDALSSAAKQPITDAEIFINGISTSKTDLNGNFVLTNLNPGDVIRISKTGYVSMSAIIGNENEHLSFQFAPIWELDSASQVYLDIPEDAWFEAPVRKLYELQVLSVEEPQLYRPADNLTRAELAVMIVNAAGFLPENPTQNYFCDVTPRDWYASAVSFMFENSWIGGNTSTSCILNREFRPDAPVNRAEAVKMILLGFAEISENTMADCEARNFSDVRENDWFYEFIEEAHCNGLVSGYDDNSFRPGNPINRAEISSILANALENL